MVASTALKDACDNENRPMPGACLAALGALIVPGEAAPYPSCAVTG